MYDKSDFWRKLLVRAFTTSNASTVTDPDCSRKACFISMDPNEAPLEEYDTVVINVGVGSKIPKLEKRNQHQRWVMLSHEAPPSVGYNTHFDNFFNWTMTYKQNSDIELFYGRIHSREQHETAVQQTNMAANKTKLVAWFVSNCKSFGRRETYVSQLQKYIPVDIYGAWSIQVPQTQTLLHVCMATIT